MSLVISDNSATCCACSSQLLDAKLSLGELPVLNRFSLVSSSTEHYPLSMGACGTCGLVQLIDVAPPEALTPRVNWIRYREPDVHLPAVANHIFAHIPRHDAVIRGFSPFDAPLLDLLRERHPNTRHVDMLARADGHSGRFPYIESIEAALLALPLEEATPADVVTYRFVLEHCRDPIRLLKNLGARLAKGGVLVLEIPDSTKFLERFDYSFIWEEHTIYFTEASARELVRQAGLRIILLDHYPSVYEDSIVILATFAQTDDYSEASANNSLFCSFLKTFALKKSCYADCFKPFVNKSIALIGIGHQALMFSHLFGLSSRIRFFVDDDPVKRGHFAAGITSAIIPFDELPRDEPPDIALLAVGSKNEERIRDRLWHEISPNVRVCSIYEHSILPTLLEAAF